MRVIRIVLIVTALGLLFGAGVTTGAVGAALLLGRSNDAGTRTTLIHATASGAVLRVRQDGTGAGLVVEGPSAGIGLDLRSGALRVAGAGLDSPTAAFVFRLDGDDANQNDCQDNGNIWYVIDNPVTNGRADALLFVQPQSSSPAAKPVWLGTDGTGPCQIAKWALTGPSLTEGPRYNILALLP